MEQPVSNQDSGDGGAADDHAADGETEHAPEDGAGKLAYGGERRKQKNSECAKSCDSERLKDKIWRAFAANFKGGAELLLGFCLLVVAYWQYTVYSRQATIMQTQTDIAKQQLAFSQSDTRAWVVPTNVRFENLNDPDDPLRVRVDFQNVGREPGEDLKNSLLPRWSTIPIPENTRPQDLPWWFSESTLSPENVCADAEKTWVTSIVYPTANPIFFIDTTKNESTPVADIKAGQKLLIISGCFVYETVGLTKHTAFARS